MFSIFIGLMIIFAVVELIRLDPNNALYTAPAVNKLTGRQTTVVEAWIGRMAGDGLLLVAIMSIVRGIIFLFS